jgi:hypothetical protein
VLVLTCLAGEAAGLFFLLGNTVLVITGTCNRLISFPILALAKQTVSVINGRQVVKL